MADASIPSAQERRDFFISYTHADQRWAEWIGWQLEEAGYSAMLQAWDFHAGGNFVLDMDTATKQAERTIALLSPEYFASTFTPSEWAAAFRRDPKGEQGLLIPVRVRPCDVEGLLGQIVYVDLVDRSEQEAQAIVLAEVQRQRRKPLHPPAFPSLSKPDRFPGALPPIWNVPYPRNVLFTGRDALLEQLAANMRTGEPTALGQPQAISGLGGIGKTQIALEYAYRHRQDYQAVLWAQADTRENLTTSSLALARLLELPEKDVSEAEQVVAAVKRWLQNHTGWLLILDNADDLALARDFLPPSFGGHLLLTTRAQATGRLARCLEVETLPQQVGALFLLRRAGRLSPDAPLEQAPERDQALAGAICDALGGLPLALDQAGAYIEETGCGLADYQHIYQQRRQELLSRQRDLVADHPASVTTTFTLAFRRVEQVNPAAADLLRLCAYLAPDAIAEEIITASAEGSTRPRVRSLLGWLGKRRGSAPVGAALSSLAADPYLLNQAIDALRVYSLVRRNSGTKILSVHRLVQAVLQDTMEPAERREWAERAVLAVTAAFPGVEHASWPQCERLLPHALVAAQLIDEYQLSQPKAARLLNQTGSYLHDRARYQEAEPLYQRALVINEQEQGPEHPDTASILNNLALLYWNQGRYAEAEPLYQRALAIYEQQLGPAHPDTATSLNNLALLYDDQGQYAEAEPLYQRALAICGMCQN